MDKILNVNYGTPKIIFRIKELQDKLVAIKEGIRRETQAK